MTERAFVMVPLADIAPQAVVNLQSIADWASEVDSEGIEALTRSLATGGGTRLTRNRHALCRRRMPEAASRSCGRRA
jgi:hypothetical protein